MNVTRTGPARRVLLAAAGGLLATVVVAAPAWAHVEVEADKPQAGARDVTLTFTGEAESTSQGIVSERVVLPSGINPADVQLKKAPKGWQLTAGAGDVTVAGPALEVGEDAVVELLVAQLPADSTTLVFKTVETYSGGKVSRWIEVPEEGQPESDDPAPVLTVKAAASASSVGSPSAQAPSAVPASAAPSTAQPDEVAQESGSAGWIIAALVGPAVLIAGGLLVARRRSRSGQS